MILDGATLGRTFDLCIIGAGAVGISLAYRLRDAKKKDGSPLQVAVLESGVRNVRDGCKDDGRDARWCDPLVRDLDNGATNEFVGNARKNFLTASRTRCFGGSTNCWGGYIRPLDDSDFRDWPLTRADLDPFYREALQLVQLDYFDYFDKPDEWLGPEMTASQIGVLNPEALKAVGLGTVVIQQQNDPKILNFQEQFSWVFTEYDNITLIRNATAVHLGTAYRSSSARPPTFRATTVTCGTLLDATTPGPRFTVTATRYVLAMGGLEIPRFLLNSIPGSIGLSELVTRGLGRYYMNHPKYERCLRAPIKFPEGVFNAKHRAFFGGVRQTARPTASVYAYITPLTPHAPNGPNNFRMAMTCNDDNESRYRDFTFEVNFEQEPNRDSIVKLWPDPHVPEDHDALNVRRLRLDWAFTQGDATTLNEAIDSMKKMVGQLKGEVGGKWVEVHWDFPTDTFPPRVGGLYSGDHHMGTCRMRSHDAADDGVVDSHCQVSGFDNLWICSTGVFRTGGWANATLTLLALACRLADELEAKV